VIAKVHTTNNMADDIEDIFVWGEDFEAILAILEEDSTNYDCMDRTNER